jgi:adenylylsulfate kinase
MSWAAWVTGLPGSGKSTIARAAAAELRARGVPVSVLELDVVRKILTPAPTYTDVERDAVYRMLVYLARLLTEAGAPVIIDATAHRRQWRDLARATLGTFAEVQLVCPLPVCQERERTRPLGHAPRGVYAAAGRPAATVPGVDVPYEPALSAELTIDTSVEDIGSAARRLVRLGLELAAAARLRQGPPECWAIWITGLPGSGKTTLAGTVTAALAGRGVTAAHVEFAELRDFVLPAGSTADDEEFLHRALVCAAKVLTDAGVAAVIDATAPRRTWRDLARQLIDHFAEVQLICPPEVCGERERAVRWNLCLCAHAARPRRRRGVTPDLVTAYEHALRPELVIHTDVRDVGSAAEEILRLAQRLHATATASPRLA